MGQSYRITPEEAQREFQHGKWHIVGGVASAESGTTQLWGSSFGEPVEKTQFSRSSQSEGVPESRYKEMELRIKILEEKFNQIEEKVEDTEVVEIVLKDITLSQAKQEIAQYFKDNDAQEIGYEELIEELKIEPKMVINACNELVEEGKIG